MLFRHEKPIPAKKPVPAKKPSLPAAKGTEDSPPPKPLRKSQSLARQQSDDATVTGAPPKPARPHSTYEPDKCTYMCIYVYMITHMQIYICMQIVVDKL